MGDRRRARADRVPDRRLAHRRGPGRRLARRRARPDDGARDRPQAGSPPPLARRSACGSSTGPTRRAHASPAACSAPRRARARSFPMTSARLRDATGTTLGDALANCGVDLDQAPSARRPRCEGAIAYLELHIEQGPVLLDSGPSRRRRSAARSGVERHLITFSGQAAHAGSTPMHLRRDTLAAAARAALAIRESAHHARRRRYRRQPAVHSRGDHRRRRAHRDATRPAPPRRATCWRRCSTTR